MRIAVAIVNLPLYNARPQHVFGGYWFQIWLYHASKDNQAFYLNEVDNSLN
jgi:hypothetical protein